MNSEHIINLCKAFKETKDSNDQSEVDCLAAVSQYGLLLQYVQKRNKTYRVCLAAVKANGWAYSYVPKKYRIHELQLEAVKRHGDAIQMMHDRTPEIEFEAVRRTPKAIKFVEQTPELCLMAVTADGMTLEHIKSEFRTTHLCNTAINQCGEAIEFLQHN